MRNSRWRTEGRCPANLIRLSVGGEHPDDIIADLAQALDAAKPKLSVSTSASHD